MTLQLYSLLICNFKNKNNKVKIRTFNKSECLFVCIDKSYLTNLPRKSSFAKMTLTFSVLSGKFRDWKSTV